MSDDHGSNFITGFVLGGAVGALIALLYAPKAGKEMRSDLGNKAEELYGKAKEEYGPALEKARKSYEAARQRFEALEKDTLEKAKELEELTQKAVVKGKEKVAVERQRLRKAVDAGKGAFQEAKQKLKKEPPENSNPEAGDALAD